MLVQCVNQKEYISSLLLYRVNIYLKNYFLISLLIIFCLKNIIKLSILNAIPYFMKSKWESKLYIIVIYLHALKIYAVVSDDDR